MEMITLALVILYSKNQTSTKIRYNHRRKTYEYSLTQVQFLSANQSSEFSTNTRL